MAEILTLSGAIIKELGILAFMILAAVGALAFLVWRITKTQDKINLCLDAMLVKLSEVCTTLSTHDRQGQNVLKEVVDIKEQTTRIDANVQVLIQQGARR